MKDHEPKLFLWTDYPNGYDEEVNEDYYYPESDYDLDSLRAAIRQNKAILGTNRHDLPVTTPAQAVATFAKVTNKLIELGKPYYLPLYGY